MRRLIEDGRLTIPLYHGTRSVHMDSIRSLGLGSRNVVEEVGIRTAAALLLALSEEFREVDGWVGIRHACEKIAEDSTIRISGGREVFSRLRYGGTYLSPSRETAAGYARAYESGGEALSCVIEMLRKLLKLDPELASRREFSHLLSFTSNCSLPVVVEVHGVCIAHLRAEQGGSADRLLAEVAEYLAEMPDICGEMAGQHNFELIHPVPAAQLSFYHVEEVREYDENGCWQKIWQFTPI